MLRTAVRPPAAPAPLLWRWVIANVAGEIVGFGAAGALMVLLGPVMVGVTGARPLAA